MTVYTTDINTVRSAAHAVGDAVMNGSESEGVISSHISAPKQNTPN